MPVLVTGASGFLGGRLAEMLAAGGAEVRILARPGSDLRHLGNSAWQVVRGSPADSAVWLQAVHGVTEIYHCAGCSTDWASWDEFREANVTAVRCLLRAAAQSRCLRRLVHVSTTDIYGYPHLPCDETHPPTDVKLPYNRTKCQGEQFAWEALREGVPVTIVRPASIYGPRGKAFVIDVAELLRRGLMAVIDGGRSAAGLCFVDNVAGAMIQAAACPAALGQAYNLADGGGITWRSYVDALADALGYRRAWLNIPSSPAFAAARVMEGVQRALHLRGRPLLTRHAVLVLSRSQEYPTGKARRDFGFEARISFGEGLARTVHWLRERTASAASPVLR